tara:strand:+ start:92 stop:469 length:378 start_codon:yes stop_codon:yes gene_type:complete
MAQSLNTAYGHFKGQTVEEFEEDSVYFGCDVDRPGAEGMCDMAEIYYDYYFNEERRWDNPEGWDLTDPYWHGPGANSSEFCPTIPEERGMLPSDYWSPEDWEEWEAEQEFLAWKEEGGNWRDENT